MTRKLFAFFISFVSILGLMSCSSTPEQKQTESWNELQESYPRERFLTAIGEGETLEISQQQALFNLSQNFSVRVSGVQSSNNSMTSTTIDGKEEVTVERSIGTNVRRHTDQLIQGAEVYPAEQVSSNIFRSLAVLEKTKGRRLLTQQIFELDSDIESALNSAGRLGEKRLETAGWLQQAIKLTSVRNQRQQQLRVLGGQGIPYLASEAELKQGLNKHLRALPFSFQFDKKITKEQKETITNALAQAGIRQSEQQADYRLAITMDAQKPFRRDKLFWQTAQLTMGLTHLDKPLGEILWNLKAATTVSGQIHSRMNDRIHQTLTKEAVDRLVELAEEIS